MVRANISPLLRPRSHLPLLDAYGGLTAEREALAAEVRKLHQVQSELRKLLDSKEQKAQRIDMLQYQVKEIAAAGLQPGRRKRAADRAHPAG